MQIQSIQEGKIGNCDTVSRPSIMKSFHVCARRHVFKLYPLIRAAIKSRSKISHGMKMMVLTKFELHIIHPSHFYAKRFQKKPRETHAIFKENELLEHGTRP